MDIKWVIENVKRSDPIFHIPVYFRDNNNQLRTAEKNIVNTFIILNLYYLQGICLKRV
jgi:hypothetical protein